MNKSDARLLNPITQNYLRQQAIRLREQGKRIGEIAVYLGVHRTTVSGWWRQYQQEGEGALTQQPRGAKLGEGRSLSPAAEAIVQRLLREYFPDELNIDSALWTRAAVQALIACECGVQMPIRTVGEYLKRWGYTPQKPRLACLRARPTSSQSMVENRIPSD